MMARVQAGAVHLEMRARVGQVQHNAVFRQHIQKRRLVRRGGQAPMGTERGQTRGVVIPDAGYADIGKGLQRPHVQIGDKATSDDRDRFVLITHHDPSRPFAQDRGRIVCPILSIILRMPCFVRNALKNSVLRRKWPEFGEVW